MPRALLEQARILFRATHYRQRRPPQALPEVLPAPPPEGDDRDRSVLAQWIAANVSLLDPPYREVLTRTELQGLTQREAAQQLGLTLPAVKARVRRGRAELLRRLDRCCEVQLDHRGALVSYEPRTPCQSRRCCPEDTD